MPQKLTCRIASKTSWDLNLGPEGSTGIKKVKYVGWVRARGTMRSKLGVSEKNSFKVRFNKHAPMLSFYVFSLIPEKWKCWLEPWKKGQEASWDRGLDDVEPSNRHRQVSTHPMLVRWEKLVLILFKLLLLGFSALNSQFSPLLTSLPLFFNLKFPIFPHPIPLFCLCTFCSNNSQNYFQSLQQVMASQLQALYMLILPFLFSPCNSSLG